MAETLYVKVYYYSGGTGATNGKYCSRPAGKRSAASRHPGASGVFFIGLAMPGGGHHTGSSSYRVLWTFSMADSDNQPYTPPASQFSEVANEGSSTLVDLLVRFFSPLC